MQLVSENTSQHVPGYKCKRPTQYTLRDPGLYLQFTNGVATANPTRATTFCNVTPTNQSATLYLFCLRWSLPNHGRGGGCVLGPCRATVPPHRVCRVTLGRRCVVLCCVVLCCVVLCCLALDFASLTFAL